MVYSMAVDLAGSGINSNCIAPGYIDSRVLTPEEEPTRGQHANYALPQIPSRRGGLPGDIAGAAIFLASDLGSYVNGQTITVDGGLLNGGYPGGGRVARRQPLFHQRRQLNHSRSAVPPRMACCSDSDRPRCSWKSSRCWA